MLLNTYQKICVSFFIVLIIFWIALFASGSREGFYNDLYAFLYGLIPLFGGIAAVAGYKKWGGLSTILGRGILFMGLGLFLWGVGESIWAYYNFFLDVGIPYPSWADLFFAPSVFCYTLGAIFIARTTGTRFALKRLSGKVFLVLVPIAALIVTYYVIVVIGRGGQLISDNTSVLKSILDVAYPLGDAISLAVSIVVAGLSFKYIGGLYKYDIMGMLIGLALMFVADSIFSYTTTMGVAYNGGWGDLIFTFGIFFLTCGLLGFNKLKNPGSDEVVVV